MVFPVTFTVMKKANAFLLTLFFTLCITGIQAQTGRKSWLVGGNAHARREFRGGPSTWNINLTPNAGYFVADNFAMGLWAQAGFSFLKTRSNSVIGSVINGRQVSVDRINESEYAAAPFLRGYIGSRKLRPFLQAQIGYFKRRSVTTFLDAPDKQVEIQDGVLLGAGAGVAYFVSDYIALEAFLNSTYNDENYWRFPPTNVGMSFGLQFHLPNR